MNSPTSGNRSYAYEASVEKKQSVWMENVTTAIITMETLRDYERRERKVITGR